MPRIIFFQLLFLFALSDGLTAQYSDSAYQRFDRAIQLTHDRLYQKAIPVWEALQKEHPDHPGIDHYTGLALFNAQERQLDAIPFFEDAVADMSLDHDPFLDERSAPVDVHYYLGRCYHLAYRFEEAIQAYRTFRDTAPEELRKSLRVEEKIKRAERAKEMVDEPVPVIIQNLGPDVNSPSVDHSPVPSAGNELLFFTSRRLRKDSSNYKVRERGTGKHFEQIYVSRRGADGTWKEAKPLELFQKDEGTPATIGSALSSEASEYQHTATSMISKEDGELVVYRSSGREGDLYRSERKSGEQERSHSDTAWTEPKKLEEAINSDRFENHYSISGDEKRIFFVSSRSGGYGGKDIYGMNKLSNGDWSEPYNLGPRINTSKDEEGPTIHPNGKLLYFSSKGHGSMGGFDVFSSRFKDDGTWSEPRNLGYPINTPDDDVYFMPGKDGRKAYYSADYKGNKRNVAAVPGFGEEDLHVLRFPGNTEGKFAFFEGMIEDPGACGTEEGCRLLAIDEKGDTISELDLSIGGGRFRFYLPSDASYKLEYLQGDEKLRSESWDLDPRAAYRELNKSFFLDTLQMEKEGGECKLTGPAFDLEASLKEARGTPRGPDGLYEVTSGELERREADDASKETGRQVDTVRIVKRDTINADMQAGDEDPSAPSSTLLYEARFSYNGTPSSREADRWELVDTLARRLEDERPVKLRIKGSASRVPTSSYSSNTLLAAHRAKDLKAFLIAALEERGAPLEELEILELEIGVEGPSYQGDPENEDRYAPHQYVEVRLVE